MVFDDEPDILASEGEEMAAFLSSGWKVYFNDFDSDDNEPAASPLPRKRFKSERCTTKLRNGAATTVAQQRAVQPENTESGAECKTWSRFDMTWVAIPRHRVKLRRDRLLDVEHAPDRLKAVCRLNQLSSPFLRLPWEIKHQIYKLAIGGQHIHIMHKPEVRQEGGQLFKAYKAGGLHCQVVDDGTSTARSRRGFPLAARTCRQFYTDTALTHYAHCKFSFSTTWVMKQWFKSLAPVQRRALTRLVLPVQRDLAKYLLKDLTGLRQVCIPQKSLPQNSLYAIQTRGAPVLAGLDEKSNDKTKALWDARGISVVFLNPYEAYELSDTTSLASPNQRCWDHTFKVS